MGFCVKCGNQTDGKDPLCNACKGNLLSQDRRIQKENGINPDYTNNNYGENNMQQGYDPNMNQQGYNPNMNQQGYDPNMGMQYMNMEPKPKYWANMFDDPMKAYQRICDNMPPMNPDFDISEYKGKFNWGAFLWGAWWVAFNVNFVLGFIYGIAMSALSWGLSSMLGCFGSIAMLGVNIFVALYANEITWKTRAYEDKEKFKKVQKIWAWAWVEIIVAVILIYIVLMFVLVKFH